MSISSITKKFERIAYDATTSDMSAERALVQKALDKSGAGLHIVDLEDAVLLLDNSKYGTGKFQVVPSGRVWDKQSIQNVTEVEVWKKKGTGFRDDKPGKRVKGKNLAKILKKIAKL